MPFEPGDDLSEKDLARLAKADAALEFLRTARVASVRAEDFSGMATWGFASFRQVWLHRTVHLTEGVRAEWNAKRRINGVILLRSLIETISAFNFVLEQGYGFLKSRELRAFHDQVMRAMWGSRQMQAAHPEMPKATNALTLVDKLDRRFKGVRRHYDALSEVAHPNADGTAFFGRMNFDKKCLDLGEFEEDQKVMQGRILAGLAMLEFAKVAFTSCDTQLVPLIEALEREFGRYPDEWPRSDA